MSIGQRTPLRILLLEDDEDHVFLIRRALRDVAGVDITLDVVSSGDDVLSYLEIRSAVGGETWPHVAFLDIRVPKLGGLDVLERIRTHPAYGELPVVLLTSSEREEDRLRARDLGADGFVSKPLDGARFRTVVQDAARRWADHPEDLRST
jgi:two-component system response regulator